MGGAVSSGVNNDDLIDNLIEAEYIKTAIVERVFRAVDRAHYFTAECKERAYRDIAWKCGNLHISAPCVYSKVMESLKLAPGLSFLNLGSGTGYLSTMAGLILGPYGTNHGIEIHEDVLSYAELKLQQFLTTSSAIDKYEFCVPKFVYGNCLDLDGGSRQYDRVYCSAACPDNYESYMKNLIKVGGILVIPMNDQLLQICRTSDTHWVAKAVLPVSFATLVSGRSPHMNEPLKMPETYPLSLQEICRFVVRSVLRKNIDKEHPELHRVNRVPVRRVKGAEIGKYLTAMLKSNSRQHDSLSDNTLRYLIDLNYLIRSSTGARFAPEDPEAVPRLDPEAYMEDDPNFTLESASSSPSLSRSSSGSVSDEMSQSDFEELKRMLAAPMTDRPLMPPWTEPHRIRPLWKPKKKKSKKKTHHRRSESNRRKNYEDLYPCGTGTDFDSDSNQFSGSPNSDSSSSSSPTHEIPFNSATHTTYMKEKINLLPLPLTLKYFLNLNREL